MGYEASSGLTFGDAEDKLLVNRQVKSLDSIAMVSAGRDIVNQYQLADGAQGKFAENLSSRKEKDICPE